MSDNRPIQLVNHIEAASEKNDLLILDALSKLENEKTRGKLKVTVESICKITGLSRNTVRNRKWALERIKDVKNKVKSEINKNSEVDKLGGEKFDALNSLRERVKNLLEQNSLLYEEILSLHRIIERKNAEIEEFKIRNFRRI